MNSEAALEEGAVKRELSVQRDHIGRRVEFLEWILNRPTNLPISGCSVRII